MKKSSRKNDTKNAETLTPDSFGELVKEAAESSVSMRKINHGATMCNYCLFVATVFVLLMAYKPLGFAIAPEVATTILQTFVAPVLAFVAIKRF